MGVGKCAALPPHVGRAVARPHLEGVQIRPAQSSGRLAEAMSSTALGSGPPFGGEARMLGGGENSEAEAGGRRGCHDTSNGVAATEEDA